tara:strand:- start:311 stop:454 length:144 start_codon:yes stop_codon:yes gene_type:complete
MEAITMEFMNGFNGCEILDWITMACFMGLPVAFLLLWTSTAKKDNKK